MSFKIITGDIIRLSQIDAIVNPSNGVGFMGGIIGKFIKLSGIAESIQYKTKGTVEAESKKACKKNKFVPRIFCGLNKGDIFITSAGNLPYKYIIHAVTVKYPGFSSDYNTIEKLLPKIIDKCKQFNVKSVAIPLLGTGVGGLSEEIILKMMTDFFQNNNFDLNIFIVIYKNKKDI